MYIHSLLVDHSDSFPFPLMGAQRQHLKDFLTVSITKFDGTRVLHTLLAAKTRVQALIGKDTSGLIPLSAHGDYYNEREG
jgi:hypothetical protein